MNAGIPVRWVLSQPELGLVLKGGGDGLGRSITLALTSELTDAQQWLSGGELVLTTGMGLPLSRADRLRYLEDLDRAGVAGVGFGIGLSHETVPEDLVETADRLGLPLFEVPLPTPFGVITKKVMQRLAEQEYEKVLRASRAQPRMTRAAIQGVRAVIKELSAALSATVLVVGSDGAIAEAHPRQPAAEIVDRITEFLTTRSDGAGSGVIQLPSRQYIVLQAITAGQTVHGHLAVVTTTALSSVDQVLLGHASSLLALDFEKPARLRIAQNRLNSQAMAMLLDEPGDPDTMWQHLATAADRTGRIRALVLWCASPSDAGQALKTVDTQLHPMNRQLFAHLAGDRVAILLPGSDNDETAEQLLVGLPAEVRATTRAGLSAPHLLRRFNAAIEHAELASSAAVPGARPLELAALAGHALLAFPEAQRVLTAVSEAMLQPLVDYDERHGTDLIASLRAYLEAHGQWETAATALGVHRHTLRSRIAKIESVLGVQLDQALVRAELLLAVVAHR
ncbi:PucR family transcriptional regulator [Nocardia sp. SYP-A9097]|uniref:PucR family transcriptional regulator n=1 Tax=Nocardia sp. SYP-A9097 TaxID=2663237 RepID=UPI0013216B32|nr:PucR family transcriptional regulator [Nocardia sp. SYP-A9097]MRH88679.1 PucR family transcriptional regulator [Nocardia sp. SYP-A9097]